MLNKCRPPPAGGDKVVGVYKQTRNLLIYTFLSDVGSSSGNATTKRADEQTTNGEPHKAHLKWLAD